MSTPTFFWHDYETTGTDPRRDRPSQFAGIRTTLELEIVAEPVMFYCQPAPDVLPHPQACLITGITPQHALRDGVIEAEFASRVLEQLGAPGTCGVGYNSLRFDDEITRNLLYRNFHDPYEREWKQQNSRWDLIDLVRMCYALRPHGINWPLREDGMASFRLEDLARANQLQQTRAHDALSDVEATIQLARLIRTQQPRLFDYYFGLRRKQRAAELLDHIHRTPVLHVSSRYPASRGCLTVIAPLAQHPQQANAVIVYDLDVDPTPLLELDAEEIADRVFVSRADLPEDIERIPLKLVHTNRSPALAPMSTLKDVDHARIQLDTKRALAHLQRLQDAQGLTEKLRHVFASAGRSAAEPIDPELAIYAGFPSDQDKSLLAEVRRSNPQELTEHPPAFQDPRYTELLFRYRARNWPESLDAADHARWQAFRRRRLDTETSLTGLTLAQYADTIRQLRSQPDLSAEQHRVLDALEDWGKQHQ